MNQEISQYMAEERICVIVPTYNNAGTLMDIISRIREFTHQIIVVNDGSTDDTQRILAAEENLVVVDYTPNRGKGCALKMGFERAVQENYRYAITIDSDVQHFPEDIPLFIEAHRRNQQALIVGARELNPDRMRRGSNFANKFSNFWFNFQTGLHLNDTQSGYRLYPITSMNLHWPITARYESELEFLVYSAWKGIDVISIPVRVYYPPKEERVSSFRPIYDFTRISILNTVLTVGAIIYYFPKKILRRLHL